MVDANKENILIRLRIHRLVCIMAFLFGHLYGISTLFAVCLVTKSASRSNLHENGVGGKFFHYYHHYYYHYYEYVVITVLCILVTAALLYLFQVSLFISVSSWYIKYIYIDI